MSTALSSPVARDDHLLGSPDAPLVLVMYADFQCPYCLGAQGVVRRVRERLGDRLLFVFRHMPIVERHPVAQAAAEASEAAAAQGRFWEYHDALFAGQRRLTDSSALIEIAKEVGLDSDRLARELEEGRWRERVERDARSAVEGGVSGTPAFFVNGRLHTDVYDAGTLVAALSAEQPG